MSWNTDVVLDFLELYRSESVLWDPKHPGHRNRSEVNDAWLRIRNTLSIECTVDDLKKKKESLMTSFRLHYNKKKNQESYKTNWFAYSFMESFLIGKYEPINKSPHETEFFDTSSPTFKNTINRPSSSGQQSANKKNKETDASTEMIYAKKRIDDAVSCLKRVTADKQDLDEYDLYGQLLAKKLRKLDERQRDHAMHDIDNIMFRAKMQSDSLPQMPPRRFSMSPVCRKISSPVFISLGQQNNQYEHTTLQYEEPTEGHTDT